MTQDAIWVVDIGGTSIKTCAVNNRGTLVSDMQCADTPTPSAPEQVLGVIATLWSASQLQRTMANTTTTSAVDITRIAIGFPGVVTDGVTRNAPNLGNNAWRNVALSRRVHDLTACPVRVLNDVDLQGYGVVEGQGVELVLTLGTGLGGALFVNGSLVPNFEPGHHPMGDGTRSATGSEGPAIAVAGLTYEERVGNKRLQHDGAEAWSRDVHTALGQLTRLFNPRIIHLGGGNARHVQGELPEHVKPFELEQAVAGAARLWLV